MKVQIKKTTPTATLPKRGSAVAAGFDLYADTAAEIIIPAHSTVMVGTGLAVAIPNGYFGGIYARSGLASKQGLRPANCVGVVDADYRGEVMVALHNDTASDKVIAAGERIAQLIIQQYLEVEFEEVDKLSDTERGDGGFGSTGKQ